jgi:hypothetical protein
MPRMKGPGGRTVKLPYNKGRIPRKPSGGPARMNRGGRVKRPMRGR